MNYELPHLPASDLGTVQLASGMHQQLGHSDEAMRAYALAVARDVMRLAAEVELQACAKVCDDWMSRRDITGADLIRIRGAA